jgi:catechol 2,3-dioxygenase-like lactoylglutathione lyase family enzyme
MALHKLASITIGVPNVEETARYYADFGLTPESDGWFSTTDGGRQLRVAYAPTRRMLEMRLGVDDRDDLERIMSNLQAIDIAFTDEQNALHAVEPVTGVAVKVEIASRLVQKRLVAPLSNGPGRMERVGERVPNFHYEHRVTPRRLGHGVLGTTDYQASARFFLQGIGFKLSDIVKNQGAFMRCSTDHHNLLVIQSPVSFLHHTSWQVDNIDEVGRGAMNMLEGHPERHVWGLGRHYAGSNFFWYLKDPAGNFSEYYSDMDCIVDDQLWKPEELEGARGLFEWGPPPPPSFVLPEDMAAMMTGTHTT